jgi:hypothetical protein
MAKNLRKAELIESFEKHGFTPAADFSQRPISDSASKMIQGALLIDVLVFVGALLSTGSTLPSFVACLIGLGITRAWIVGKADPLTRLRWSRFWHGDLLAYWLLYLPLMFVALAAAIQSDDPDQIRMIEIVCYAIPCAAGMAVGFINVKIRDKRDKEEIMEAYREWRSSKDQPVTWVAKA